MLINFIGNFTFQLILFFSLLKSVNGALNKYNFIHEQTLAKSLTETVLKNGRNKLECLSLARLFSQIKCKALALWAHSKDNVNMVAEVTDVTNFAP